jgi:hypothetical protein
MKHASIVFRRHKNNSIFEGNEGANFGGWYFPFRHLREGLRAAGIELSTTDVNTGRDVLFELHINVQRRRAAAPMYCYDYEHPHVRGINGSAALLARYRQVYTWNETLIDGRHIHRLEIPNDLTPRPVRSFEQRDLFCVMIAKNKEMRRPSDISLYEERLRLVRGFEQCAPDLFSLYGKAWDIPPVAPGIGGRLLKLWQQWRHKRSGTRPFPSWRGTVGSKDEVLSRAKFSLCYENLRGGAGYITEKLFDSLVNGCVPVYAGASDIARRVPPECYIDGDRFTEVAGLVDHLQRIGAAEYAARQQAMQDFLASPAGQRYGQDHFCRTLIAGILGDLGLAPPLPDGAPCSP